MHGEGILCAAAAPPVASLLQAVCRTVFQSQRKAFNSKAHRLEGEAAKLAAEAEKKAKRGGAVTGRSHPWSWLPSSKQDIISLR
jgi:hypothetical protein